MALLLNLALSLRTRVFGAPPTPTTSPFSAGFSNGFEGR